MFLGIKRQSHAKPVVPEMCAPNSMVVYGYLPDKATTPLHFLLLVKSRHPVLTARKVRYSLPCFSII
jgi:hypothetical protein